MTYDSTHFDPIEAGRFCHEACGLAEIARLRAEIALKARQIAYYTEQIVAQAQIIGQEKTNNKRLWEVIQREREEHLSWKRDGDDCDCHLCQVAREGQ